MVVFLSAFYTFIYFGVKTPLMGFSEYEYLCINEFGFFIHSSSSYTLASPLCGHVKFCGAIPRSMARNYKNY